jgi:acetyl esterase/lipase
MTFRGWLALLLVASLPCLLPAQTNAPATNSAPVAKAPPPPPPEGIEVLQHVVIGKGGAQDLHALVAYPKDAPKPMPAVIFIHGGGWKGGGYATQHIFDIAKKGYFTASIEYRLSGVAKWPAQIQDCKLGIRWLRANAAKYSVDPNRIAVWGESAGGHLVACLGTMGDVKEYEGDGGYPGVSSAVQAVVDFYGPTDFVTPGTYTPYAIGLTQQLMGSTFEENPEAWKKASPITYVKAGDPPVLILQGDRDGTVPMKQSTMFDEALTKAGVPHQLVIVKNGSHGFRPNPNSPLEPSIEQMDTIIYAFLDKYLKAPQSAP